MARAILVGAILVGLGALSATLLAPRPATVEPAASSSASPQSVTSEPMAAPVSSAAPARSRAFAFDRTRDRSRDRDGILARRLEQLEARLDEEAAERRRLEAELDAMAARLNAGGGAEVDTANAVVAEAAAPAPAGDDAASEPATEAALSEMERALMTAGIDEETAAEIKRRQDDLALAEVYLRDQAAREGWLDSPRFKAEMDAIHAEQTPIRDEIGDDAYDHYLFARGEMNRVLVDDVMLDSPAAEAGLQAKDLILSYDGTRVFAPGDLVAQTHEGVAGELVRVEVSRNGERFEIEVPRGPLGLRIGAAQDTPEAS